MGSLQSAILGFGAFRLLERRGLAAGLTVGENVIVQTTAVATATMPLAAGDLSDRAVARNCRTQGAAEHAVPSAGLVGVIPALGMLGKPEGPVVFSTGQLIAWSLALAFLGVFCAVPLRTQTILREKLVFPSGEVPSDERMLSPSAALRQLFEEPPVHAAGTATAKVIRTLHETPEPSGGQGGAAQPRLSSMLEDVEADTDEEVSLVALFCSTPAPSSTGWALLSVRTLNALLAR